MRTRFFPVVALISLSILGVCCGALSASAVSTDDPTPTPLASGSSQVGFTVLDTASPTPTTSPGGGSGGHGGSGGSGGSGGGGTTPPVCVPSTKTPVLSPTPPASTSRLHLTPKHVSQGQDILVKGDGFQPGEKVVIALYSTPVNLGVFTVRTNGQIYAEVAIPKRTQLGTHALVAIGFQDCRVAASSLEVVSPRGSGTSIFPWIVWLIAGGGVGVAAIGILIAFQLGWLPAGAPSGMGTRVTP